MPTTSCLLFSNSLKVQGHQEDVTSAFVPRPLPRWSTDKRWSHRFGSGVPEDNLEPSRV